MPTRIGDMAQSHRLMAALQASSSRTRQRAAPGLDRQARDPLRPDQRATPSHLLRTQRQRALNQAHVQQNEQLTDRLQLMDQALGSIVDIADRARTSLAQRLDAARARPCPSTPEVDSMLAELAVALNPRLDEPVSVRRHRTDTAPVHLPAAAVTTAGPERLLSGRRGQADGAGRCGRRGPYGVTADDPAFAGLIAALGQAKAAHLANDRPGLQLALDRRRRLSHSPGLRDQVGAVGERLESIADGQQGTAPIWTRSSRDPGRRPGRSPDPHRRGPGQPRGRLHYDAAALPALARRTTCADPARAERPPLPEADESAHA